MRLLFLIYSHTFLDSYFNYSSGDSTARIWPIADGSSRSGGQSGSLNVLVLKHVKGRTNEKSKDVTTLDWNVSFVNIFYDVYTCMLLMSSHL